jgi:Ca2+-binding RTX toxin-like protein
MFTFETAAIRVNTNTRGQQQAPEVIGLAGGGFVVGWSEKLTQSNTSGTAAFFQRYDAAGNAQGTNTQAAVANAGGEQLTDLLALSNGTFAVGWLTTGANVTGAGFNAAATLPSARVFDANGVALTGDVTNWAGLTGAATFELVTTAAGIRGVFNQGGQLYTVDYAPGMVGPSVLTLAGSLPSTSQNLQEAVSSPDGTQTLALITVSGPTSLVVSTAAPNLGLSIGALFQDLTPLGADLYAIGGVTNQQLLTGIGSDAASYLLSATGIAAPTGFTSISAPVNLRQVAYDAATIIEVFSASFFTLADNLNTTVQGVFVRSHNVETGITSAPTLVDQGVGTVTALDITRLAGGSIAVTWARNGALLNDVYMRVLDFQMETTGTPFTDDSLAGAMGTADLVQGFGGNDTLVATTGADTLDGGSGLDRASFAGSAGPLVLDLLRPANNAGAAETQLLLNIEVVEGSAFNDRIFGTNAAERLIGNAGNDMLRGRGGADTLEGGGGNDTLDAAASASPLLLGGDGDDRAQGGNGVDSILGGAGNDSAFGASNADTLDGQAGDDMLDGGDGFDLLDGGAGNDRLFGRDGNDTLFGGLGADLLTGLGNNDHMDGEEENDTLLGGAGADTLLGGDGDDVAMGGDDNDIIDTGEGNADQASGGGGDDDITAGAGTDRLYGDEGNDEISGGAGNDYLNGGQGGDVLTGDAGNDYLRGESGADTLDGGAGNDTMSDNDGADMIGGDGFDHVSFNFTDVTEGVRVYMDNFAANSGIATNTRLHDIEAVTGTVLGDTLYGSGIGNALFGVAGNDLLDGGFGDDTLVGGFGNDTLAGGAGSDLFRFDSIGDGVDTVADFTAGDRVAILRAAFANINAVVLTPIAATQLSNAGARLFFDTTADDIGSLYFDANGADTANRILIARIYAGPDAPAALAAGDFLFV